jgi:hypothetical protein
MGVGAAVALADWLALGTDLVESTASYYFCILLLPWNCSVRICCGVATQQRLLYRCLFHGRRLAMGLHATIYICVCVARTCTYALACIFLGIEKLIGVRGSVVG